MLEWGSARRPEVRPGGPLPTAAPCLAHTRSVDHGDLFGDEESDEEHPVQATEEDRDFIDDTGVPEDQQIDFGDEEEQQVQEQEGVGEEQRRVCGKVSGRLTIVSCLVSRPSKTPQTHWASRHSSPRTTRPRRATSRTSWTSFSTSAGGASPSPSTKPDSASTISLHRWRLPWKKT